mmetsp:Transcript_2955/g.8665  ORF Transcript_2955/g.8665 Transcript_2955/m.8665 type:complete len:217 (-) Transcript_2955:613-1263(-)
MLRMFLMYLLPPGSRAMCLARTAKRSRCLLSLLMYTKKGTTEGCCRMRRSTALGARCTPSTTSDWRRPSQAPTRARSDSITASACALYPFMVASRLFMADSSPSGASLKASPASYVDTHSSGASAFEEKARSMWRTLSVDTTVVTPSLPASKLASVLLPVPLVPHSSTVTHSLRSCNLQGVKSTCVIPASLPCVFQGCNAMRRTCKSSHRIDLPQS